MDRKAYEADEAVVEADVALAARPFRSASGALDGFRALSRMMKMRQDYADVSHAAREDTETWRMARGMEEAAGRAERALAREVGAYLEREAAR